MTRRTKFVFGSLPFTSIKAVEAHARFIRGRHPRGQTINDPQDVSPVKVEATKEHDLDGRVTIGGGQASAPTVAP